MKKVLTGIKPTGVPHLGNYIGAIKPAIELQNLEDSLPFYFVADYHALNQQKDKLALRNNIYDLSATWLALGLDPEKSVFYRQSDIAAVTELTVILSNVCSKGLMNRAHAYKASVDKNIKEGNEPDAGINMGLFNYPILMAADILLYNTDLVPVGKDQLQHIEIARDLAQIFNNTYDKEVFTIPEAFIQDDTATIVGLDGRKMSKSYDNVIPIMADENKLYKLVKRIITDSSAPTEPKDPNNSTIFDLYKHFATNEELADLTKRYASGISWNDAKEALFEVINRELKGPREDYKHWIESRSELDKVFENGGQKAFYHARKTIDKVKKTIGIKR